MVKNTADELHTKREIEAFARVRQMAQDRGWQTAESLKPFLQSADGIAIFLAKWSGIDLAFFSRLCTSNSQHELPVIIADIDNTDLFAEFTKMVRGVKPATRTPTMIIFHDHQAVRQIHGDQLIRLRYDDIVKLYHSAVACS